MKKITVMLSAAIMSITFLCSPTSVTDSVAFSGTIGKGSKGKNAIHPDSVAEHCKLYPTMPQCRQAGKSTTPPRSGTKGSGTTGSGATTSGSSEHGSVRGTINAGGDFIAPKLQPKKPKSVAPRLTR